VNILDGDRFVAVIIEGGDIPGMERVETRDTGQHLAVPRMPHSTEQVSLVSTVCRGRAWKKLTLRLREFYDLSATTQSCAQVLGK
jgi:hypothetical protein